MSISANDLCFGIEFETTIPAALTREMTIGSYHGGRQVPFLPQGWNAESDASIRTIYGRVGCEFVSPKLQGIAGLMQVVEVLRILNEKGCKVNESCGVHVHVSFDKPVDSDEMKRLTTLVAHFEKAIYASTGTKRRETGRWCNSVARHGNAETARRNAFSRYQVLNTSNIADGRRKAVEFRAFAGTLNANKVAGHIRMCLALVERAINDKRCTDWTMRGTKSQRKSGPGASTLSKLFYAIGWTKGRVPTVYGNLEGEGIPTLKDSKKALMQMARKYDKSA